MKRFHYLWERGKILPVLNAQCTDLAEKCAFLIGDKTHRLLYASTAVSVPNRFCGNRHSNFKASTADLSSGYRPRVIGVIHSHLEDHEVEPSEIDLDRMHPGYMGIIWHPSSQTAVVYVQGKIIRFE